MLLSLPIVALSSALACGPFFPHTLLGSGAGGMLTGPYADFGQALGSLDVVVPDGVVGNGTDRDTAELIDAKRELGAGHAALPALERFRDELERFERGRGPVPTVPPGLPEHWRSYLEAVRLDALGERDAAARLLHTVFDLPPEQTGSRGLWAGHTLMSWDNNPKIMFAVRARVVAGEPDTLGLTGSALGWLARGDWDLGYPVPAVQGYVAQHRSGDPTAEASLRWVLKRVVAQPEYMDAVAKDPVAAGALTAWMVSGGGTDVQRKAWLATVSEDTVPAGMLAWLAWLDRDMQRLPLLLERADDVPMTRWLKARQAMLAGDLDTALPLLEQAGFPADEQWQCAWYSRGDWEGLTEVHPARETASERGALLLRKGENEAALRAFAEAGHWFDTAHVAERVVRTEELRAAVEDDLLTLLPERQAADLRQLLGRRLFRDGDPVAAAAWFPEELAAKARRYAELIDTGTAPALFEAARMLRFDGIELSGTELDPDFAWARGGLPAWALRQRAPTSELHGLTDAEADRINATAPSPDARFHYRYQAAELAWQAAERIPAGHPEAPKVLCQAGRWLMHRDPPAADRYYKEMVWRGWGTPLARTADDLRWFPDAEACALDAVTVDEGPGGWGLSWLAEVWARITGG